MPNMIYLRNPSRTGFAKNCDDKAIDVLYIVRYMKEFRQRPDMVLAEVSWV